MFNLFHVKIGLLAKMLLKMKKKTNKTFENANILCQNRQYSVYKYRREILNF
jgi:hypothetical protein